MPATHVKNIVRNSGIDIASILAFLISLLPAIQTVIGIFIGVVILLINIERYKKIKKSNNEQQGKEEK